MARIISFKPGSTVYCGTVEYKVVGPAGLRAVKVRDVVNGETRILPQSNLSSASAEQKLATSPLDCLPPKDQDIVLKRFAIIEEAVKRNLSKREIVEISQKHGIHYTTVYRMIREYKKTESPASLLPKTHNRGGKGKSRLDPAVDDVIRLHFDDINKDKHVDITKLSVTSLHQDIKMKCRSLKLKPPTWNTVNDRLEKFIQEKKLTRSRKHRTRRITAGGTFPDANRPLDVVQIDHTPLDIILVDEKDRKPIGRPFLSVAIDVFSRMIVGFMLSLTKPGIFSVGQLIAHCILPKDDFLKKLGVDAKWDVFGVMRTLYMDNAGEFRAEDFIPFEKEYMVEISWRPVATPEYGGHIERYAKTLNTLVHNEPGSTFSNIVERDCYDSEGKACYTIDEMERWLCTLITKIYHEQPHSELGMCPRKKYEIGIIGEDDVLGLGQPDAVEDQDRLKLFLLPSFSRTIQRDGIELDKISYFHDILRHWVGRKDQHGKSQKYLFKRDPRDISRLFLFDPERQEYFAIPYKDLTRPPMTAWDLEASKRQCKEVGIFDPDEQQIFSAYAELRKIREDAVAKTKQTRREREIMRRRDADTPIVKPPAIKTEKMQVVEPAVPASFLSFYEDASLLEGVIVQKKAKENPCVD